jgi:alkylated DNA repair protein alkB family protein 1
MSFGSIGLPAVFLVGGPTRDTAPIPFLLRSGDACIMAGPCRRVFHGVPRVLEDGPPAYLHSEGIEEETEARVWSEEGFDQWMKRWRLNINVRQVFDTPRTAGEEANAAV